ncbi:hypothetical protein K8B05_14365 [Listeria monocytogenes]|nr:hypothetical protein [Listeria monocytogenes]
MSFENDLERISNNNTKKYLREVISSFENQNYRSAIVMLYSVFMTDLWEKLNELKNDYFDEKAKNIVDKIKKHKSWDPSREEKLIKDIRESNLDLLSNAAYATWIDIKNWRNICAHPSLEEESMEPLLSPNKLLVGGLIKSSLDNLFTQSAFLGTNVFSNFLDDLNRISKSYYEEKSLKTYLSHRYFERFTTETFNYVLKNLFKICFCVNNPDTNKNRQINMLCLKIMIKRNRVDSVVEIQSGAHFNNIQFDNDEIINSYCTFLMLFPELYSRHQDYIKNIIEQKADIKVDPLAHIYRYYIESKTLSEHLKNLSKDESAMEILVPTIYIYFNMDTHVYYIYNACVEEGDINSFIMFASAVYASSKSFDMADTSYTLWIKNFLNHFNHQNFENLIDSANRNSQCYNRSLAVRDHKEIYANFYELEPSPKITKEEFDEKWPNFIRQ